MRKRESREGPEALRNAATAIKRANRAEPEWNWWGGKAVSDLVRFAPASHTVWKWYMTWYTAGYQLNRYGRVFSLFMAFLHACLGQWTLVHWELELPETWQKQIIKPPSTVCQTHFHESQIFLSWRSRYVKKNLNFLDAKIYNYSSPLYDLCFCPFLTKMLFKHALFGTKTNCAASITVWSRWIL